MFWLVYCYNFVSLTSFKMKWDSDYVFFCVLNRFYHVLVIIVDCYILVPIFYCFVVSDQRDQAVKNNYLLCFSFKIFNVLLIPSYKYIQYLHQSNLKQQSWFSNYSTWIWIKIGREWVECERTLGVNVRGAKVYWAQTDLIPHSLNPLLPQNMM